MAKTKTTIVALTKEEIRIFLKQVKKTHFYKRIQFIQYKKEGLTHQEIARLLSVCLKTLTNWMGLFSEGGMERLVDVSYQRRVSKLCVVEEALRQQAGGGALETVASCQQWLKEEHRIVISASNLRWFLKKNAIVLQENEARTRRDA